MSLRPTISVVTPVHNTAPYLAECIESVLAQTYSDYEYVILDNCSTDGSLEIALKYAARDARIRVERTENLLGQVANYNAALGLIGNKSKYCKIVQADDWLYPECLGEMIAAGELDPEVAIVGAYQMAGQRVRSQGLPVMGPNTLVSVLPGREACRRYLLQNLYLFGSPTSIMYRSDVVRGRRPFFHDASYHEDSEVCFDILRAKKFAFIHRVLTYTRVDNVSLSNDIQGHEPNILHAFIILHRFGAHFLSRDEYALRLEQVTNQIYSMLSYRMLKKGNQRFWDYHRRGFEMAGQTLSFPRLWRAQIGRAISWLGNPLLTLQKILDAARR